MRKTNPKIDWEAPAAMVLSRFGKLAEASRALGKSESTLYRWLESGAIPAKHQSHVLQMGKALKPALKAAEFIDTRPARAAQPAQVAANG